MTSFNKSIKVPFAVSLALIFGYSLLQVAVPTEPDTANAALAASPNTQPRTASMDEQIVKANAANAATSEPAATLH